MNTPTPANCIPQLDWEILRAELTQLRKVCDELAKQLEFHRQQMVGLRREIEHQKARVAAWEKVASPYPPNN